MRIPNPEQAHASIATTGNASTLATLGYVFDAETATLLVLRDQTPSNREDYLIRRWMRSL